MILGAAKAVLQPYLIWIRLGLALAFVAALAIAAWRVQSWHAGYLRAEAAESKLEDVSSALERCTQASTAAALAYANAIAEAAAVAESDRATTEGVTRDLTNRLQAADAGSRDLARRLRDYEASRRGCTVPLVAGGAADPDRPAGEPGRDEAIGGAVTEVFAACRRDSERLAGWIQWWAGVKANRGPQP